MPRPVSSPWTLTREDSDDRLAGPTSRFTSWIPTSSTLGVMSRMGFTIVRLCGTHWHGIGWALESSTSCVDFGFSDLRSCFPMSVSSFASTTSSRTSSQSTGRLSWSPRGAGPSRCGSRLASLLVPHEPNELYESREQHPPVRTRPPFSEREFEYTRDHLDPLPRILAELGQNSIVSGRILALPDAPHPRNSRCLAPFSRLRC